MPFRTVLKSILMVALTLGWIGVAVADASAPHLIAIPDEHDRDLKFYAADGSIVTGTDALARMQDADLTLWVAGNQFFAMDKVIGDFRRGEPGLSVGPITLPKRNGTAPRWMPWSCRCQTACETRSPTPSARSITASGVPFDGRAVLETLLRQAVAGGGLNF